MRLLHEDFLFEDEELCRNAENVTTANKWSNVRLKIFIVPCNFPSIVASSIFFVSIANQDFKIRWFRILHSCPLIMSTESRPRSLSHLWSQKNDSAHYFAEAALTGLSVFLLLLCGNRWGYLLALPLLFLLREFLQIKLPRNFIRHSIGWHLLLGTNFPYPAQLK